MREAIVEARRQLAKGRALWNGPCHQCDAVLKQALAAAPPAPSQWAEGKAAEAALHEYEIHGGTPIDEVKRELGIINDLGWRPIATAPRDGTRILLTYPASGSRPYAWGTVRVGKWNGRLWQLDMAGNYQSQCTHWQPLPPPPSKDFA
jgi:hypothetical protein